MTKETENTVLGIDIGGTGIKAALVNIHDGQLVSDRYRIDTPSPSTPAAVAYALQQIVEYFRWSGLVGVGFPAIIKNGVAFSAANIHQDWLNCDVKTLLSDKVGMPVAVINDADAAGLAAARFGAGKDQKGLVLFLTIGTGVGSALIFNGELLPNTEFGHLYYQGDIAEKYTSNAVRKNDQLSMKDWGTRLSGFLNHLERTLSPDLIILGGGGGKKFAEIEAYLKTETKVVPAILENNAGIIGAAWYAWCEAHKKPCKKSPE